MSEENNPSPSDQPAPEGNEQIKDVGVEELAKAHEGGTSSVKESGAPDLGLLLDIPVTLSLELGSTRINLGDLLRLNKGAIVELEKEASEPLEVKVNGTLIAYADVVVVNDRYGIRMIDVISESERLRKLS
ncbi:flagellar motor switch protein FliN [Parendozoicomonas haliclonae]|uniref:Flagellar motor switch protein FliN n=1 Tax=Parendozoicomonas haliclonae TaxID=1960125 RepID=A0A1X7AGG7_9GAMM|nr:flagellar motor switch protein FliN [Parendozoicomonas haliclonae]SMA39940.1 Flagellar motor switch protein FliN [Parendozoicomonas haliclonae]